jgi:hypothetical protein
VRAIIRLHNHISGRLYVNPVACPVKQPSNELDSVLVRIAADAQREKAGSQSMSPKPSPRIGRSGELRELGLDRLGTLAVNQLKTLMTPIDSLIHHRGGGPEAWPAVFLWNLPPRLLKEGGKRGIWRCGIRRGADESALTE